MTRTYFCLTCGQVVKKSLLFAIGDPVVACPSGCGAMHVMSRRKVQALMKEFSKGIASERD